MEVKQFSISKLLNKSIEAEAIITGLRKARNKLIEAEMLEAKGKKSNYLETKKTIKELEKKLYLLLNQLSLMQKQLEAKQNGYAEKTGFCLEEENAFT